MRKITGKVTDEKGNPLPGVTVVIQGTTKGTISDANGNYSLQNISPDETLEFSFVGMQKSMAKVGNHSVINVTMTESTTGLNEVVVVGYGTQKKSDLAGSVASVNSKEILESPAFNALEGLSDKIAGVTVFSNSGDPTGDPRVLIRGMGSINSGTDPLYVVDGVAMDGIDYLNPNDIEHIEVLKDASSTAIYGARGSNGVILITTKRGLKKTGVDVSYNGYVSMGNLPKEMHVLNSEQFMQVIKTGFANAPKYQDYPPGQAPVLTLNDPNLFDSNGNPLYNTDWQKASTRTAISQNHELSIQQGGENSSIGAFLNFSDNEGIMLNSWMKRLNAKLTYDVTPKKWLSFGVNLLVNYTWSNETPSGTGAQYPLRTMVEMAPIFPVHFPNGAWSNSTMTTVNFNFEGLEDPVHVLKTLLAPNDRTQIFGNTYLTFHILNGLDLKTQIGVDGHINLSKTYYPTDLLNISSPNGNCNVDNDYTLYWQQENYLSYDKVFGDHRINAVLGLSWQEYNNYDMGDWTSGFSGDNFYKYYNMGSASIPQPPYSSYNQWTMNSYFVRAAYTFKDRYLATFTAREDGSSRFGKNNKYGFFPSGALGWIISNEQFMKEVSAINQLKLRVSYGITGNTEIGSYNSLSTVSSGTVLLNGSRASASWVNNLPNPNLKWERTSQLDAGIDLSMANNRVSITSDYYYKLTSDLLLNVPLPSTTGFGSVLKNIGSVSNKGFEISLTTQNILSKEFSWVSSLNASYNKNTVVKLGENNADVFPGPSFVGGDQIILRVGKPLDSFYGYTRYGTWGTSEAADAAAVGAIPGEAKRSTTENIIGKGIPDWVGGFSNRFNYKNFDLTIDLQFVFGVNVLQQIFHPLEDRTGYTNGLIETLTDAWTPNHQNTMIQQIRNGPLSGMNTTIDSHWVANGSFVRGNLISFGYTFSNNNLNRLKLKGLRVYASVDNAFLLDSKTFKGYDPELASWGGQFVQNMDFYQYPKPRTITVGVNVKF
jgi:TonB-linked SusC/RagA family outer membrane protein